MLRGGLVAEKLKLRTRKELQLHPSYYSRLLPPPLLQAQGQGNFLGPSQAWAVLLRPHPRPWGGL